MWHTGAVGSETEPAGRVHSLTTSTNAITYVRDCELVVLDKTREPSPTPWPDIFNNSHLPKFQLFQLQTIP